MQKYIKKIETEMMGGNCFIDFIHLNNGQVLAIDNDLVGLYDSIDHFYNGHEGKLIELKESENDDDL